MTRLQNPFAPRVRGANGDNAGRIKSWVLTVLPAEHESVISVTELACAEQGCPPVETMIVVMRRDGTWIKARVHKALREVSEDDVLWALREAASLMTSGPG